MQKSAARIFCAILLMAIALTFGIGWMGSVFAEPNAPETQPVAEGQITPLANAAQTDLVLVHMLMVADADIKQIELYNSSGTLLETLQPDAEGMAVTELMAPGLYLAVTKHGDVLFTLHENASISTRSGSGWSDGERLFLTSRSVGTITVLRSIGAGELSDRNGWLDYALSDGVYSAREVVRHTEAEGTQLSCTFYGVPYGTYMLSENGEQCTTVRVSEELPAVEVLLP